MMHLESEPACVVRGLSVAGGEVRLVTRNLTLTAEGQTSVYERAAHPSALDLLVSALVADLLAGLHREAARDGVRVHNAELVVAAHVENPLVALGVVGEQGSAALSSLRGSLYVSADAPLDAAWARVLERGPVYATLRRCVDVHIDLKPVP